MQAREQIEIEQLRMLQIAAVKQGEIAKKKQKRQQVTLNHAYMGRLPSSSTCWSRRTSRSARPAGNGHTSEN